MEAEVAELKREIADLKREFRKEVREMQKSCEFFNNSYEEMKKECEATKEENAALKSAQQSLTLEVEGLKKQLHDTTLRVTAQDQYSRNKNLEIKGVPVAKNENLVDMLGKVGDVLGTKIEQQDIEACHRVPTRKNDASQNIVVVLNRRAHRDEIIEKARKARFTTEDLGLSGKSPVYVNEHLCPPLKKLLGLTIAKKKELNWQFAWAKGGKVFAKKTETSPTVRIVCERDLEKIK